MNITAALMFARVLTSSSALAPRNLIVWYQLDPTSPFQ